MTETGKSKNAKGREKPGRPGPNPVVIGVAVLVLGLAAWLYMSRGDRSGGAATEADDAAVSYDVATSVVDLGKAFAVGPSVERVEAPGTDVVPEREVPGLTAALDGVDPDAVAKLLEEAGARHLLVDPSITVRDPIPPNTVRNRLALGRPAGRLSAVLMSRTLCLYDLTDGPLRLSREAREAMTGLVRRAAGVAGVEVPQRLPAELEEAGDWRVIVTLRAVDGRRIGMFNVAEGTLAKAAEAAGGKLEGYYNRQGFDDRLGPLPVALTRKVGVEVDVLYDEGKFMGPRDPLFMWRVIEPGIHGVRIRIGGKDHQPPPSFSVTSDPRTVDSILERVVETMGGRDSDYWKKADVPIVRFRSVHWRERTPGGELEELYRASSRTPSTADVTRENLLASLVGLNDWLADNAVYPDGRMIYRYFPVKDEENAEYNGVRHALGPFSMALTQELAPNDKYWKVADAGLRYMEDRIRWGGPPRNGDGTLDTTAETWMGKPIPGADVAIYETDENEYDRSLPPDWSNKMGGVAVAILGYTQAKRVGWKLSPERERILRGLAAFLLYMQKEDGSFHHYYVAKRNKYYDTTNSIYPGEILYAIARLFGETGEERYRTAFKASMKVALDWFKAEMAQREPDGTYVEQRRKDLVQFQPWIAMAMEEMHRYDPDPSYVEASNLVSLWIMDTYQYDETRAFFPDYLGGYMKVLDELPAMHTFVYTEGTAASYMLARRAGSPPDVVQKLRRGCLLSARFILQMQARPGENDYYYPNPTKAKGGVRYCMNHNKQRIDYTYHALSSVYRIIHAATPEDYEYIHSIEMPGEW